MPPTSFIFHSLLKRDIRADKLFPRLRQIISPGCARASRFSTQSSLVQRSPTQHKPSGCSRLRSEWRTSFSTAALLRARPDDAKKNTPLSAQQDSPSSTTPLSKSKPRAHENIYNIPNFLTLTRLVATPLLGYLIVHDYHLYAFTLFIYAGVSDLLDGWIARKWHLQTVVGSVVDPMADKALMTTLVTCLAFNGTLPLPLATLILGRDASLAIAAIYFRYASLPAPKTFARYWDFSLPSAEVHPTTISKLNTFLQLGLIGTTMGVSLLHDPVATQSAAGGLLMGMRDALGGPEGVEMLVKGMSGVVAGTTVYSGLSYAWMKSAVKILGDDEALKRKQGFRGRMIIAGTFGSVIMAATYLWLRDEARNEDIEEIVVSR